VRTYSDDALKGIIRDLTNSGEWPSRLRAASIELQRRRAIRR